MYVIYIIVSAAVLSTFDSLSPSLVALLVSSVSCHFFFRSFLIISVHSPMSVLFCVLIATFFSCISAIFLSVFLRVTLSLRVFVLFRLALLGARSTILFFKESVHYVT